MFYFLFVEDYEKLKKDYVRKKMEQMVDIEKMENKLMYLRQFIEPDITIRLGPNDLQYLAETSILKLDNPQPQFIQIVVGQKTEFKDFIEASKKGRELIMKKLALLYPHQFQ
jgi:hypothetical protein